MSEIKTLDVEVSFPDILDVDVDFGQTLTKIVAPEHYMGPFEFYPSDEDQVIPVKDKTPVEDICVKGITGEKAITENGTYDILEDKEVTVDVNPDLRPLSVSENGTYEPDGFDGFSQVSVDVPNRGYDIPKIDDGNAHIWVDVLDQYRDMKVFCYLVGEAVVSVDWGDGTEEETYYGRDNVGNLNHDYEQAGFYHIVIKTVKEPQRLYQKAFGGSGNSWLLGGSDNLRRCYQACLVGFESGNWVIRGGQLLYSSICYAAYYKHATGITYNNYLSNCKIRHYELPDIATSLGNQFFENDPCVGDFVIPERIVTIGSNVFNSTGNIKIHMESAIPPALSGSLGNNCLPTIYVPAGSLEAYKTAPNWSNYADSIFEEPTALTHHPHLTCG